MKQFLLCLALVVSSLCTLPASAHHPAKNPEQHAIRLSQSLGLDDATTARFIPLYNQYRDEMQQARKKYHRVRPEKREDGKEKTPLTDEQIKKNIENSFALSQSILDIRKSYYKEFLKILTPRQIQRMYEMEKTGGERLHKMGKKHKRRN